MVYIFLTLIQLVSCRIEAAVLNVDPADSTGYQTIAAALDSCKMWDTLMLAAGTYRVDELNPFNPVTIMGTTGETDLPRIIGKEMFFREDIRLQNLRIDSSVIAIRGLQGRLTENVISDSRFWCELSDDIKILNNEFINSAIDFYHIRPEVAFNIFRYDSLHQQGTALHYISYPGVVAQINLHHNTFINTQTAVEISWPCQPSCAGNYTIDLSDNWWGLTDTAAILALSGESEMSEIGDATIQYRLESFLDAPPGSSSVIADSVYGLSFNTFEDISHAVVINTFLAGIEDYPGISGFSYNPDQSEAAICISIDGRVVTDRSRIGKGVYIVIHRNAVKKVLLLK